MINWNEDDYSMNLFLIEEKKEKGKERGKGGRGKGGEREASLLARPCAMQGFCLLTVSPGQQ